MANNKNLKKVVVSMSPKEAASFPLGRAGGWRSKIKVVVAMSGGVDSSVAAALLKRADFNPHTKRGQGAKIAKNDEISPRSGVGVNVIGVFMKFWSESAAEKVKRQNRCCSSESENLARKVAKILKIPFYVFNFEREFKKRVVDYFLKEHKRGLTPNPCVVCNKEIKFGLLLEKALGLGADFIATGHYARITSSANNESNTNELINKFVNSQPIRYSLMAAKDGEKDQSYFLWQLNQKQLKRILFPIGNYTKKEVRKLAKKFGLPAFDAPESQEICFIPDTIEDFLKRHIKSKAGKIIDDKGRIVGQHQGLWFYTIGQRKGIGLAGGPAFANASAGNPYYVLAKDLKKNYLIVTKNEKDLYKKELVAKDVKWILEKPPKLPLKIKTKIRYRHEVVPAKIYKIQDTRYKIQFERPQRAITAGQSVVFYLPRNSPKAMVWGEGQELLGGGIIC